LFETLAELVLTIISIVLGIALVCSFIFLPIQEIVEVEKEVIKEVEAECSDSFPISTPIPPVHDACPPPQIIERVIEKECKCWVKGMGSWSNNT